MAAWSVNTGKFIFYVIFDLIVLVTHLGYKWLLPD